MVRLDFKLCNVPWLPKLLAGVSKIIVATRIIGKACQNNWAEVVRGSTSTLLLYQLWRKKLMPWQFWAWSSIWSHPPLFKRTGRDFPAPMYFHICMTIVGNGELKKYSIVWEKKWPSSIRCTFTFAWSSLAMVPWKNIPSWEKIFHRWKKWPSFKSIPCTFTFVWPLTFERKNWPDPRKYPNFF